MKTQQSKLTFKSSSVAELNKENMYNIVAGTSIHNGTSLWLVDLTNKLKNMCGGEDSSSVH